MSTLENIKAILQAESDNPDTVQEWDDIDKKAQEIYKIVINRLATEFDKKAYVDKSAEALFELIKGIKTSWILEGVAYAPNVLTLDDVKEGMKEAKKNG